MPLEPSPFRAPRASTSAARTAACSPTRPEDGLLLLQTAQHAPARSAHTLNAAPPDQLPRLPGRLRRLVPEFVQKSSAPARPVSPVGPDGDFCRLETGTQSSDKRFVISSCVRDEDFGCWFLRLRVHHSCTARAYARGAGGAKTSWR